MSFLEIFLWMFGVFSGIAIIIRIAVKFDLNRYLEEQRKIKIAQLKNICSHINYRYEIKDKGLVFEHLFSSPVGTLQWSCSRCGLIVNSEEEVNRIVESFNPKDYIRKSKKFYKQAKKLKLC